ncbi:PQQ-binding-like beta-propeller repeat protein [Actinophytocola sp.]|uniref:outer membrane protein assembly factor BamB family protein n=1 Tax=Actinophytocola sp. TaxID=1872138 RepID=UPI0025B8F548|nr:PQQ-binding-like beta-propeller repeat protein [Actinophytocola sp.]
MQRGRNIITAAVLVTCMAVACTAGPAARESPPPKPRTSAAPAVPEFDPPMAFSPDGVTVVDFGEAFPDDPRDSEFPYLVDDGVVYFVLGPNLEARDLATGESLWTAAGQGAPNPTTPVLVRAGGRAFLHATFHVTEPGSGTTQDRELLRVARIDAATGEVVWATDIADLPEGVRIGRVGVVGADEEHVVVSPVQLSQPDDIDEVAGFTAVLDAGTGDVRWQQPDLWSFALAGGVVGAARVEPVGFRNDHTLVGRSAVDGRDVWVAPEQVNDGGVDDGHAVGPDLYFVHTGSRDSLVVAVATGKVLLDLTRRLQESPFDNCHADGRDTIVCAGIDGLDEAVAAGYDVRSGKLLWQLPDESANRIAPEVHAARNGAVYGSVEDRGVVLDARTGEDEAVDQEIVPTRVVRGFGLRLDRSGIVAYPATK